MRILIDGDACPSKHIVKELAKKYHLEVHIFVDTSHYLNDDEMEIHIVSKGMDAVDMAILSFVQPDDLVITQDYGLASLVLTRSKLVVNPLGFIYSDQNIDELLFKRHISKKSRQSGHHTSKIKKRTSENDEAFQEVLIRLISRT